MDNRVERGTLIVQTHIAMNKMNERTGQECPESPIDLFMDHWRQKHGEQQRKRRSDLETGTRGLDLPAEHVSTTGVEEVSIDNFKHSQQSTAAVTRSDTTIAQQSDSAQIDAGDSDMNGSVGMTEQSFEKDNLEGALEENSYDGVDGSSRDQVQRQSRLPCSASSTTPSVPARQFATNRGQG